MLLFACVVLCFLQLSVISVDAFSTNVNSLVRMNTLRKVSGFQRLMSMRGGSDSVIHVKTIDDYNNVVKNAGDKLIVLDFFATWCAPCRMIAPAYEELAASSDFGSKTIFLKVDVDQSPELAKKFEVMSMPTFVFVKNDKIVDRFSGASVDKLKATIKSRN